MSAQSRHVQCLVFVNIRHVQQLHERVPGTLLVREMVRLRFLNECELVVGDPIDGRGLKAGITFLDVSDPLFLAAVNRELGVFPGIAIVLADQSIDEMIESRSHVVDQFASPHSEHWIGESDFRPSEDVPLIVSYDLRGGIVLEFVLNEFCRIFADNIIQIDGTYELEDVSGNLVHAATLTDVNCAND